MTIHMKRDEARELFNNHRGEFFSVRFIKKNGEVRDMRARTGVKKGLKGVGLSFSPRDYGLLPVYDLDKQEYRFVNLNTLIEAHVAGERYVFHD